jgi:serine phosphatase RsbU (regulator of sigma subunit)
MVMDNRALAPEELTKSLLKDIGVFVADEPQSDDITIMILKRKA